MRLIDADRYKEELESLIEICDFEGENDVKEGIQSAIHTLDSENFTPTVDAEPIIRCKDCKHWRDDKDDDGILEQQHCVLTMMDMGANGFCSMGEREDEQDD